MVIIRTTKPFQKFLTLFFVLFLLLLNGCAAFQRYLANFSDDGRPNTAEPSPQRQGRRMRETTAQATAAIETTTVEITTVEAAATGAVTDTVPEIIIPAATDGFVRLTLNQRTGSFSLQYHPDVNSDHFEPLFSARDPRTSFLSVSHNGRIHHLGRSRAFNTTIDMVGSSPALVFESDSLTVRQIFSPVRTLTSNNANGVMITITIENTSGENALVGLRFILDTHLGEARRAVPFMTDLRAITSEFLIDSNSDDKYWISVGENISLMGSIRNPVIAGINPNAIPPTFVHFANWKRLNDSRWDLRYLEDRSFSNFPFSIRDSAVSYIYEPLLLESGDYFTYIIFLTTQDLLWYYPLNIFNLIAEDNAQDGQTNLNIDMLHLIRLQELLDQFIAGMIELTEYDLIEIERTISRHRN